jgi:hypothetical protein
MSSPDLVATLENAEEIAELTGRTKADVIADLLDDGKLNNSNAIKENTSALDRATEMAGKTHKLLTAIIPILILLAGSGLELGGIIDLTPAGEGDEWAWEDDEDEYYQDEYWGCTEKDASNYDPMATIDDGSCYWETEAQADIMDIHSSYTENDEMKVEFYLSVSGSFDSDIELVWVVNHDGEERSEYEVTTYENPADAGHQEYYWSDLDAGEWVVTVEAVYNGELLDEETAGSIFVEEEEEPEENCTASFYFADAKLVTGNNTTNMEISWDADWSCDATQYIEVDVWIIYTDNQTQYYGTYAGYNITAQTGDNKLYTHYDLPVNDSFDVRLVIWVDNMSNWEMHDEWTKTSLKT